VISLRQFIAGTDEPTDDDVTRAMILGLEVAVVVLPSEMLAEERVERMNALWDALGGREAVVIAVCESVG
jgi:hypothetical protein